MEAKSPKIREYSTIIPNSLRSRYFLPCSCGQMGPCFHATCYQGSLYIIPTWVWGLSSNTANHEPPALDFPIRWQANWAANLYCTALAVDLPWPSLSANRSSQQRWVWALGLCCQCNLSMGLVCHCISLLISGKTAFIIQTSCLSLYCLIHCLRPLTTAGWLALRTDNQQDKDALGILFPEVTPSLPSSVPRRSCRGKIRLCLGDKMRALNP